MTNLNERTEWIGSIIYFFKFQSGLFLLRFFLKWILEKNKTFFSLRFSSSRSAWKENSELPFYPRRFLTTDKVLLSHHPGYHGQKYHIGLEWTNGQCELHNVGVHVSWSRGRGLTLAKPWIQIVQICIFQ